MEYVLSHKSLIIKEINIYISIIYHNLTSLARNEEGCITYFANHTPKWPRPLLISGATRVKWLGE